MTALPEAEALAQPTVATRRARPRRRRNDSLWRHLVAVVGLVFALFPMIYVLSAAFDATPSLSSARIFPQHWTLHNFGILFHDQGTFFARWYMDTLIVAFSSAFLAVLLGAIAAYAFSRFRFRGRRMGMLFLLLVQMFPQLLALVAIYLMLLHTGKYYSVIGLNTLTGLIAVYLGGALGVNVWLLKGFFDTIPSELDESARVDGATAGQIFWGIVLPLGAPVLAVVGLLSFISAFNEFILASTVLQTPHRFTLAVGMRGFIDQKYDQHWGPFAAGALLATIPVLVLFQFLQRFIVEGLTGGAVKG
jgi:arabinogalactan oligomer/maltooligosaccharide transport system permease protein